MSALEEAPPPPTLRDKAGTHADSIDHALTELEQWHRMIARQWWEHMCPTCDQPVGDDIGGTKVATVALADLLNKSRLLVDAALRLHQELDAAVTAHLHRIRP